MVPFVCWSGTVHVANVGWSGQVLRAKLEVSMFAAVAPQGIEPTLPCSLAGPWPSKCHSAWPMSMACEFTTVDASGQADGQRGRRRSRREGHVVWRANVGGYVRGTLSVARNGDVLAGVYGPRPRAARLRPDDGGLRGDFAIQGTGACATGFMAARWRTPPGRSSSARRTTQSTRSTRAASYSGGSSPEGTWTLPLRF